MGQRQLVKIAKVLALNNSLIVMDEPTSSLTTTETEILFKLIENLKKEGISIVYISHKLEEVFRLDDTTTIIRDGEVIDSAPTATLTRDKIVEKMVGRSVDTEYPRRSCELGEVVLKVDNITRNGLIEDISFELRRGEILGFAGLIGSGRKEVAEAIFGAEVYHSGVN